MKSNNLMILRAAALMAGIALGSGQLTPHLLGQSPSQNPNPQEDKQQAQSFVGKIVLLKNGQYALLTDEQQGLGLYLDDQDKAKPFEGKNVKVTGTLDVPKSLVHVTDIAPS